MVKEEFLQSDQFGLQVLSLSGSKKRSAYRMLVGQRSFQEKAQKYLPEYGDMKPTYLWDYFEYFESQAVYVIQF